MNFKEKFIKFIKTREPPEELTVNNCKRYDVITWKNEHYILIHRHKDVRLNNDGYPTYVRCRVPSTVCHQCRDRCGNENYIFSKFGYQDSNLSNKTLRKINKFKQSLNKKTLNEVILIKNVKKNKKSTYVAENVNQILFNHTKTK